MWKILGCQIAALPVVPEPQHKKTRRTLYSKLGCYAMKGLKSKQIAQSWSFSKRMTPNYRKLSSARPGVVVSSTANEQGTPKALYNSNSNSKIIFAVAWLGTGVACYTYLSSFGDQLPQVPWYTIATVSASAIGASAASLVAAKLALKDSLHLEWHRGRLYIQLGMPSNGPSLPVGSIIVKPTLNGRGNGAFATTNICKGSHVADYQGELLNKAQYFQRYPDGVSDFVMCLDDEWAIDSSALVSQTDTFHAVHMNHSRTRHNVVRYFQRGQGRVAFFTTRDIKPGEELLFDYGKGYWQGRESMELP